MVTKVKLSWADIERNVNVLTEMLKNETFDAVVSIGRGGMIPARLLAEKLDIHNAYVINAKAYDKNDKFNTMNIGDVQLAGHINKILVVDDCIFTGTTLDAVMAKIAENEHVTDITNVFLYKNEKVPEITPDFIYTEQYNGDTTWLVFPWEM